MENQIFDNTTQLADNDLINIRYNFQNLVREAFEVFFTDKDSFNIKNNYRSYYYDEYELGTSISQDNINTLYVEIRQPKNYSLMYRSKKDPIVINPDYTLEKIKNSIFDILISKCDTNTILWKSEHAIFLRCLLINDSDNENIKEKQLIYEFKLVIGLSYKNEENMYGIRYYAKNRVDIQTKYINPALNNYTLKNIETKNRFTQYIIIFKNILKTNKKIKQVGFELVETILYNVPNNLFDENINLISVRNIINYIRNISILNFKTLDEQYSAFVSDYTNYNVMDLKETITTFENYYKKNA